MKRKGRPSDENRKKTQQINSDYNTVLEELLRQTLVVQSSQLPAHENYFSDENITKIVNTNCDFILGISGLIEILSDNLSLLLQNRGFAERYKIIGQWKTNPEYPETWELKMLDYSTLPLILKKSTFITNEFLENFGPFNKINYNTYQCGNIIFCNNNGCITISVNKKITLINTVDDIINDVPEIYEYQIIKNQKIAIQ
jgi:hypothetical protein